MTSAPKFDPIEDVLKDVRAGKLIIVTDDADRENEGDLVIAADKITPEAVNFMATHGRGMICAPITEERADGSGFSAWCSKIAKAFAPISPSPSMPPRA